MTRQHWIVKDRLFLFWNSEDSTKPNIFKCLPWASTDRLRENTILQPFWLFRRFFWTKDSPFIDIPIKSPDAILIRFGLGHGNQPFRQALYLGGRGLPLAMHHPCMCHGGLLRHSRRGPRLGVIPGLHDIEPFRCGWKTPSIVFCIGRRTIRGYPNDRVWMVKEIVYHEFPIFKDYWFIALIFRQINLYVQCDRPHWLPLFILWKGFQSNTLYPHGYPLAAPSGYIIPKITENSPHTGSGY